MTEVTPDLKRAPRIRDAGLFKRLHLRGVICVLCGEPGSLHHVYPRCQGGDDLEANLLGLCGHGTAGHHGLVENGDLTARADLGEWILEQREDTIDYLIDKLGEQEGREWLRRRFFIDI